MLLTQIVVLLAFRNTKSVQVEGWQSLVAVCIHRLDSVFLCGVHMHGATRGGSGLQPNGYGFGGGASCSHTCSSVTRQYNLVGTKGW